MLLNYTNFNFYHKYNKNYIYNHLFFPNLNYKLGYNFFLSHKVLRRMYTPSLRFINADTSKLEILKASKNKMGIYLFMKK